MTSAVTHVPDADKLPCRLWCVGAKPELELELAGLGCSDWEREDKTKQ